MLIDDTLFGRIDKVKIAIERLKTFEPPEGYYLAFSGGKDSQCIYHLAEMAGVKFDAHFNLTGLDPPELIRFTRKNYPMVKRHHPSISIGKLIVKKMMPPTRQVRYCCEFLKETGGIGRRVLTGVRWEESVKRSTRKMVEHCLKGKTKTYLHPILDWTTEEVWEFIRSNNLSYCSLYDEGFKRIGCIGCPNAGKKRERDFIRWPKYKARYIRAFQRSSKERDRRIQNGETHLSTNNWTDGESMFEWWMSDTTPVNPDQTVLFE